MTHVRILGRPCRICGLYPHIEGCPGGDADMRRVSEQILVDLELQED